MRVLTGGGDQSNEEISWTFNDFILGFLMIVLMMASVFAFLSNAVVVDSFVNQCEDPDDPTCGVGDSLFGGRQKGESSEKLVEFTTEEEATTSLDKSLKKWSGIGDVSGNSQLTFGNPEIVAQKENIVFEILPDGNLLYRKEPISVDEMTRLIQGIAIEKGVFLEAIVQAGTSFEVYKNVKAQLWDLTDAEHWRDVVRTEYNSDGIDQSLRDFGTTYTTKSEVEILQEAPTNGAREDSSIDFVEDSGFVEDVESFSEDSSFLE